MCCVKSQPSKKRQVENNPVAKHARSFNKSAVHKDKKKEQKKRGFEDDDN